MVLSGTKKFILLATLSVFLCACQEKSGGILSVFQDVTFKGAKGDVTLKPGKYDAEMRVYNDNGKNTVSLDLAAGKAKFLLPADIKMPKKNGRIDLAAKDSGQPYDTTMYLETSDRLSSAVYRTYVPCRRRVYSCHPYYGCGYRIVLGTTRASYRLRQITKNYLIYFRKPGEKKELDARLETAYNRTEQVFISRDPFCF